MESIKQRPWTIWIVQFLLMTALWFLFVAKLERAEALIGMASAALAATGDLVIRLGRFARFRPKLRWLAEFWRLPGYVLRDTGIVFAVLARRVFSRARERGLLRSIPFNPGGWSAKSAARRALAVTLSTIPPNTIVIGINRESHSMLIHQLHVAEIDETTRRLGAQ